MSSVKERIAALQKKSGESTLPGGVVTGSGALAAKRAVSSRPIGRSASTFIPKNIKEQETSTPRRHTDPITRSKVSALAENMKGMNLQSMLSPNQNYMANIRKAMSQKKEAEAETGGEAEISDPSPCKENEIQESNKNTGGIEDGTKFRHMKRAMIAPGSRRPRTIPTSLQGIKLSTE